MRLSREILKSYYEHVPFVINSGYAQNSRGLFGPSGADRREEQDGCQNGELSWRWPEGPERLLALLQAASESSRLVKMPRPGFRRGRHVGDPPQNLR